MKKYSTHRYKHLLKSYRGCLHQLQTYKAKHAANWLLKRIEKKICKVRGQLSGLHRKMKLAGSGIAVGVLLSVSAQGQTRIPKFNSRILNPFNFKDIGAANKPAFGDLDGDGDLDALIGESSGNFEYFENTGDAENPSFATNVTNPFSLVDIGLRGSPTLVDLDGDGDLDLFAIEKNGLPYYFENEGTATSPSFGTATNTPFGISGIVGYDGRASFADLDGDGDLDLLVGEYYGNFNYYENTGTSIAPAFASAVVNPFGLADVGVESAPAFADLDGDGDFDVLVGDNTGNISYFENTGDANNPAFASETDPFGTGTSEPYSYPTVADIDNDGDLDLFAGDGEGRIEFFRNTGDFIEVTFDAPSTNPFGLSDIGSRITPTFGDFDGDGDLDIITSERSDGGKYIENTGTATNPSFGTASTNPLGITTFGSSATVAVADLDGDGDLDILEGEYYGTVQYYENTGDAKNPTFSASSSFFGLSSIAFGPSVAFADLNSDGDLDLLVATLNGDFYFYENTGTVISPAFASGVQNPFNLANTGGDANNLAIHDVDGDGDLDLVVGDLDGTFRVYENTGDAQSPSFDGGTLNGLGLEDIGARSYPSLADLDGDGDLDVLAGSDNGDFFYFQGVPSHIWNGSSWFPDTPSSTTNAVIDGDYDTYTDGVLNTKNLTVNATYTLTVRGDSAANLAGNLVNYGSVLVQDTSSLIQTVVSPSNAGTGTYSLEREGSSYRAEYNYWSSPVQNTTIDDVFGTTARNIYTYDSLAQEWEGADTGVTLEAGRGFIATGTGAPGVITRTFSDNVGFNSGDIAQSLYYSGTFHADSNWHLIGNPYPSGLDVNQFLSDNTSVLENAVYLWSSDGSDYSNDVSDYAVMNAAGVVNAGGSGVLPSSAVVSSAQGFFVQSKATGTVSFSNSQRIATSNTFQRVNIADLSRIWLGVEKENGAKNECLLAFGSEGEIAKDLLDANKLSGNSFVSFYSIGDFKTETRKLVIQGLPELKEDQVVVLGIEAKEAGTFVFRLNHSSNVAPETEIYLADKLTGALINLRAETYSLELEKGEYNDRLELRFVTNKVTSIEEDELQALGMKLFASEGQVKLQFSDPAWVQSEIAVYDLSGRLVGRHKNDEQLEVALSVPRAGIYIVRVEQQHGIVSKKLFVE